MPKRKRKILNLQIRSNVPEPLADASPDRDLCQKCGAYLLAKRPFMRAFVPRKWTGKLLLVGERPGQDEDNNSGRPFTGAAGQILAQLLREGRYQAEDAAMTNGVRCAHPDNAEPTMTQIRCCRPFLLTEILELKPEAVLGVGTWATRALTNDGRASVTSTRGRRIDLPMDITTLDGPGPDGPGASEGGI